MRLTVVIPVLDEARRIDACLDALEEQPGIDEIIVVDGGSRDGTPDRVRSRPGVGLLESERGRARQMNAGAAAARGDTLLFLHADAVLPDRAAATIEATLARPGVVAGAFRTWHEAERWRGPRAWLLHLADVRSRVSRLPYGDQGLFLRVATFHRAGGFPELELMEDLAFARRLRSLGRVGIAPCAVRVSGRRFEAAPLYQTALVNLFPFLYDLGVSPRILARLYGNPR